MGSKSSPAPVAAAAPQPTTTVLPETQNQDQRNLGAARRLADLGQPSAPDVINGGGGEDPLSPKKTLTAGTANLMG
jgi:hypothetical protein